MGPLRVNFGLDAKKLCKIVKKIGFANEDSEMLSFSPFCEAVALLDTSEILMSFEEKKIPWMPTFEISLLIQLLYFLGTNLDVIGVWAFLL